MVGGDGCGYAELHCHTNFSFLDGASHPEELADEAARLGLAALAVTDHDGLYRVVPFALAAPATALPTRPPHPSRRAAPSPRRPRPRRRGQAAPPGGPRGGGGGARAGRPPPGGGGRGPPRGGEKGPPRLDPDAPAGPPRPPVPPAGPRPS